MKRILIIDDEPLAVVLLKEFLADYDFLEISSCQDGFEGLKQIQNSKPDLIFLDIQMPKISGFEMLELIDDPPAVIFTTAFDEYALKAFEKNALDYLLKPFSKERFKMAFQKALSSIDSSNRILTNHEEISYAEELQRIVVKTRDGIRIVPIGEIEFLEAYDDYVKIHVKDGVFIKKNTLTHYEKNLNELQFVRVHRSFILPVSKLLKVKTGFNENHIAVTRLGAEIPMSRSGYQLLKKVMGI
ncbi:MAG: response regulator [Flavobacteriales bacterium]|nr:response regulator [Flavobacteriales bacterium]